MRAIEGKSWKPCRVAQGTATISHLCFADDLLLFGEASTHQAAVMKDILHAFCHESRQRVNFEKSKTWVSSNTSYETRIAIAAEFDLSPTTDLGKYLGVPLFHQRAGSQQFQYLVDKVGRKLSGWLGRLLSQAARLVLIQSVTSAIPAYVMNTCRLPKRYSRDWRNVIETFCGVTGMNARWFILFHGNMFVARGKWAVWESRI